MSKKYFRNAQQLRERIKKLPQAIWHRIEGPGALSGELTSPFEPEPEEQLVRLKDVLAVVDTQAEQIQQLRSYVQHKADCAKVPKRVGNQVFFYDDTSCTCGLDDVLKGMGDR